MTGNPCCLTQDSVTLHNPLYANGFNAEDLFPSHAEDSSSLGEQEHPSLSLGNPRQGILGIDVASHQRVVWPCRGEVFVRGGDAGFLMGRSDKDEQTKDIAI